MRLAVTLALMFSATVANAQQDTLPATVAIVDYAKKNDLAGTAAKQFVLMRCAALYGFLSSATIAANDEKRASALLGTSANMLASAQALETNKETTFVFEQWKLMQAMYLERAKVAKARTGNWSDDPIIASDAAFCRPLAN